MIRTVILSSVAQLVFTMTTVLVGIVTTPMLLSYLGDDAFGAARTMADWFLCFNVLEFGVGGALLAAISRCAAKRDNSSLVEATGGAVRAFLPVVARKAMAGIVFLLLATTLIPVPSEQRLPLHIALAIGCGAFLFAPLTPFQYVSIAYHRRHTLIVIQTIQFLVQTCFAVTLAWLGAGIVGQSIAMVAGTLAFFGLSVIAAPIPAIPVLRAAYKAPVPTDIRQQVRHLGTHTFVAQLANQLSFLSDNLVISAILGPTAVTVFFLTQRFTAVAINQINSITQAASPAISELYYKGDFAFLRTRIKDVTRIVVAASSLSLATIAICNEALIGLWVGASSYAGNTVTFLAAANGCLLALLNVWQTPLALTGHIRRLAPIAVTGALVNFLLSVVLTFWLGLSGPLLGSLIAVLFVHLIGTAWLVQSAYGINGVDLAAAACLPLIWTAVVMGTTSYVVWHMQTRLVSTLAITSVGAAIVAVGDWYLILSADDRDAWGTRMNRVLGISGGRAK